MRDEGRHLRLVLQRLRSDVIDEALSLYVPVRREGYDKRYYSALLQDLVKRYRERLSEAERAVVGAELPRIQRRLDDERPAGCAGLAAFSSMKAGLLELVRLPDVPEARLEVGAPLVAPIDLLLNEHPPALVAVIDKEKGRILASVLGELLPVDELEGDQVKHSKAGGTSAPSNQRKADNRAAHNLKDVAARLEREVDGFYRELWLIGPPEARAALIRALPRRLRQMHREVAQASLDKPFGETLAEVRELLALTT